MGPEVLLSMSKTQPCKKVSFKCRVLQGWRPRTHTHHWGGSHAFCPGGRLQMEEGFGLLKDWTDIYPVESDFQDTEESASGFWLIIDFFNGSMVPYCPLHFVFFFVVCVFFISFLDWMFIFLSFFSLTCMLTKCLATSSGIKLSFLIMLICS